MYSIFISYEIFELQANVISAAVTLDSRISFLIHCADKNINNAYP
jgi:hypothetical protein